MVNQNIEWKSLSFADLSTEELYDIMVLRQEVFVVEQNCPYLDCDGKDIHAQHLLGYEEKQLIAYTRLLPKGVSYDNYASIGRVVNSASVRGRGIGYLLMQMSIQECHKLYGQIPIKISAQVYLLDFYQSLNFVPQGEEYLEDDIPHIAMLVTIKKEKISVKRKL